jgi:hypothetical protein
MKIRGMILFLLAGLCLPVISQTSRMNAQISSSFAVRRVLLLSIDGFHAVDLSNFIRSHPNSTLAQLSFAGVTYTQASTSKPSNSFPGLLSMITGGSPISTGVWYEGAYARSLSPPGSNCKTVGTEVVWSNSLDRNKRVLDAGGGIDPAKLPLDPNKGCVPVYPHSVLRVNTIFEVTHSAGMRTAWIDKHPSYEMVSGPSGMGVDDLFTPEIGSATKDVKALEAYDDVKVQAVLNEIDGQDHSGKVSVGVPALFGMAFQVFRFAQVIPTGGYKDASGTPSAPLLDAIEHTDQSIGKMVSGLKARNLLDSTLIIVTAKHAQAPMDRNKARNTDDTIIPKLINQVRKDLVAFSYADGNITSIWLTDQSQTAKVAEILSQPDNQSAAGIQKILWGESLKLMTNDPIQDVRVPDIVVIPNFGNIYAEIPADETQIAAHGGFSEEDTHVALLVANPGLGTRMIKSPVETTQIAPTILGVLGIDPQGLQAVRMERTRTLPGLFVESANRMRALSSQ